MNLTTENEDRKVDKLGRVSIPKSMRDRMNINPGDTMEFYLLEDNGDRYVCMTNHSLSKNKYERAAEVLMELDVDLPDALVEMIGDNKE